MKYTLYGDTNLTGTVGFNDFTRLTQHYNQTSGASWDTGDFNYDGSVNIGDFTLLTRTYGQSWPPLAETINGTAASDQITLWQDADHQHIDWGMGSALGRLTISDASGLTLNGNGGNDVIELDYVNGDPLPVNVHLNGTFTIYNLADQPNPLGNTTLDIGRSTAYVSYVSDPLGWIGQYLVNGYNHGGWNGVPTASLAVITSSSAASNAAHTTAIGFADSADGRIAGQPANTIELKYTLYGDTTLSGTVGFNDFTRLTQHYNQKSGGTWDIGDFNYDGLVNSADFTLMSRTYNTSLGNQAQPTASTGSGQAISPYALATVSAAQPTPPTDAEQKSSGNLASVVQVKPNPPVVHLVPVTRHRNKHRR